MWRLFEMRMTCWKLHTVIALDGDENLLKPFVYPSYHYGFYGPELNLKNLVFVYIFLECEISVNCDSKKFLTRASSYGRTFNIYGFWLKGDTNNWSFRGFVLVITCLGGQFGINWPSEFFFEILKFPA